MRLMNLFFFIVFWGVSCYSQNLKPGFDKEEYKSLLQISSKQVDDPWTNAKIPIPEGYNMIYRSPVVGLDNRWDLWINQSRIAIISIRGTTRNPVSWIENFYAAMLPAQGSLVISKTYTFNYKLAINPRAAVHTGWLIGTACLAPDIVAKIDSLYNHGVTQFLIIGHSQGGGLAYLLSAHFHYLQNDGKLPADIRFKTYCSAAPKPGNLYFAYDYESYTQHGWAYNVINADDWVPETPTAVQTKDDFNKVNPFSDMKSSIKKQKLGFRIVSKIVYRNLVNPTYKAQRKNQKYLGNKMTKLVKKTLPELKISTFANTSNYTRAGNYITLTGDSAYYSLFPQDPKKIFIHHLWDSYLYLIDHYEYH